jgi:hypothetical protein
MKMLMIVYSGSHPQRITSLLDQHHADGYTEFTNTHGVGRSGRREGSRAWPGESTLWVSIVPASRADELVQSLHAESSRLAAGERVHVATLPTESFF